MPDELATPHPRFGRDRWPERLAGRAVSEVGAHGKHLFLRFEGGLTIHSHLRMTGSWRVFAPGQRWTRSPRAAWLVLRRAGTEVVQFNGPVLELMTESRTRFDQRIAGLGPDILAPEFDYERYLRRLREDDPTRPIGDAVLEQRTVAGIGNLWKAEACFEAGIDPWRPTGKVSDEEAVAIVDAARPRMQQSARDGNQTAPPARLRPRRAALPALRRRLADPLEGPGRRQPHDLLVPAMSELTRAAPLRRVGHKGADLIAPGNTPASFDAALAAGVDMIEFDVLPEDRWPADNDDAARARPRPRAPDRRRDDARGGPRPPRLDAVRRGRAGPRPQAPRLRGAGGGRAARPRPGRAHADLVAVHAQPRRDPRAGAGRCGSAGRCRGCAATTRSRGCTCCPRCRRSRTCGAACPRSRPATSAQAGSTR